MNSSRGRSVLRILALASLGACMQFGACSPVYDLVADVGSWASNINPCGTVLDCNPRLYQFVTSGIDSPGVRPDIDPFCTFAPFCDAGTDPIFGGLGAP